MLAHRGGMAEAPENSRAALRHMARIGVRHMETDARLSADGVVVLVHDATLERTAGDPRPVASLTWREIAGARDGAGEAPLRLEEALEEFGEVKLNIDAKSDDVVTPLASLAGRHPERVCVTSFSSARVRRLRSALGGAVASGLGMREVAWLRSTAVLPGPVRRVLGGGHHAGACVQVPMRWRGLSIVTPRFIETAHEAGLDVHVWTVNDPEQMRELLALGVDGLVTDVPSLACAVVAEHRD